MIESIAESPRIPPTTSLARMNRSGAYPNLSPRFKPI
jgi:hypothetical protein